VRPWSQPSSITCWIAQDYIEVAIDDHAATSISKMLEDTLAASLGAERRRTRERAFVGRR
jgi:hypothetical protein